LIRATICGRVNRSAAFTSTSGFGRLREQAIRAFRAFFVLLLPTAVLRSGETRMRSDGRAHDAGVGGGIRDSDDHGLPVIDPDANVFCHDHSFGLDVRGGWRTYSEASTGQGMRSTRIATTIRKATTVPPARCRIMDVLR
jgi:hypothetical protein